VPRISSHSKKPKKHENKYHFPYMPQHWDHWIRGGAIDHPDDPKYWPPSSFLQIASGIQRAASMKARSAEALQNTKVDTIVAVETRALTTAEADAMHLSFRPHSDGDDDDTETPGYYGRRRRFSSLTGMSPVEERTAIGSYARPYPAEAVRFNAGPAVPYTFSNTGNTLGLGGGPSVPPYGAVAPRFASVPASPMAYGYPPVPWFTPAASAWAGAFPGGAISASNMLGAGEVPYPYLGGAIPRPISPMAGTPLAADILPATPFQQPMIIDPGS